MKLPKFMLLVASVTCLCLLYVCQQTEIFRLAYVGQKRSILLRDSLDKNTMLRYNINKNTSLVLLNDRITASNFEMPDSYRVVKVPGVSQGTAADHRSSSLKSLAASVFGIKRQAEARTIDRR